MKNLLKSLIVWLMLVALPFQGFAAAGMATCAPAGNHVVPVVAETVVSAMPAGHCDTMQMAAPAPPEHGKPSASHHHADGKCNTCASCCCGATMAPTAAVHRAPGESCVLADFAIHSVHVPRVDLDLPERPPKTSLI